MVLSKNKELNYKKIFPVILLLLFSCFISFGASLHNGFFLDDNSLIVNNIHITSLGFISETFSRPFLKSYNSYYRPLITISFILDYQIWKLNPFGYHLTNILLHFLNSFLLFIFLYLLTKNFSVSTVASILFAIHPINSVTLNYISDRGNLLVGFFMLGALIAFCLGYKRNKIQFYVLGSLLFIYALLSRENAVLFPLYLLCAFLILYKKGERRKIILPIASTISINIIYLLLRLKYFNLFPLIFSDFRLFSHSDGISSFFYMIFKYLSLSLFPYNISFTRRTDLFIDSPYEKILYLLLMLCLLLMLIRLRKNKFVLFGLGWFLIGVLPLYNLQFSRPEMGLIMQDSWIYFSSAGLFVLLGTALVYLKKFINKNLWLLFLSVALIFYVNRSISNCILWKDAKTYCLYWLRITPKNHFAYIELSKYYFMKGDYEKAKYYVGKAIESLKIKDGTSSKTVANRTISNKISVCLGSIALKQAKLEEAIEYFTKAVKANSYNAQSHFLLGNAYFQNNNLDMAMVHLNEAVRIDPYFLDARFILLKIYLKRGNQKEALRETKTILSLDSNYFKKLSNERHQKTGRNTLK